MHSYTENKRPKESKLCKMITKNLTKDRRENGYTKEEQANELGLNVGTLENKLKPSMMTHDITMSEFIHILETTGDYEPLEYLNSMFDGVFVPKQIQKVKAQAINICCDMNMMESNDAFSVTKKALADGKVTAAEQQDILKELQEQLQVVTQQIEAVKNIEVEEG